MAMEELGKEHNYLVVKSMIPVLIGVLSPLILIKCCRWCVGIIWKVIRIFKSGKMYGIGLGDVLMKEKLPIII